MERKRANLTRLLGALGNIELVGNLDQEQVIALTAQSHATVKAAEAVTRIFNAHEGLSALRLKAERQQGEIALQRAQIQADLEKIRGVKQPEPVAQVPHPSSGEDPITDDKISALAVRATIRFGKLPPDQAELVWARWEAEVKARHPALVATELIEKARQIRAMLG